MNLEQEKELLNKKITAARENEIAIASQIQESLLIEKPPQNLMKIQIAQVTIASQEVDGDFYDFFKHNDNCINIVVGDVMGKGIPAALLGAATKNYFLRVLFRLLSSLSCSSIPDPETIVSSVKTDMIEKLEKLEIFVTLCYARLDLKSNIISYVNCGHMNTIHYQKQSNDVILHEGENMPLGFPEKEPIKKISKEFHSGDILFFYSDGLTEASNTDGELFGEQRLVKAIINYAAELPEKIIAKIKNKIIDFTKTVKFLDDFTCVVIKIDD